MPKLNAHPALDLEPATEMPSIIVLGRDDAAKAHASVFTADQILQARAAAAAMGMMVLPIITDEQRALAYRLPAGKIFSSGRAFVPFVKGALYDQLIAHVPLKDQVRPLRLVKQEDAPSEAEGGAGDSKAPAANPGGKPAPLTMPTDWSGIVVGSVVLANESPEEGWWAAVVTNIEGHLVNLRWRDYDQPSLVRPITELALMHPSRPVTA
ncbi:hypothetical protein ACLI1C_15355 [Devosia sp. XGJD_8]|uniref:hypothetical protein n=1 Tax=Devosia sp. XGJD_8 TaxID=3391187 RepID=UPI00398479B5